MWLVRVFSVLVAASVVFIAGSLGWMASVRSLPIEVLDATINKVNIPPGGQLELKFNFIQHKRCYIIADRTIVDAKSARHRLSRLEFPAGIGESGVEQEYLLQVTLPKNIAFGTARYESTTIYRCNVLHWLWPIYSPYSPVFFEVVPL